MSSDDKIAGRSGGVEVVADQGDDGSFEIRLERQGDTEPVAVPKPVEEAGAWRAAATTPAAEMRSAPKALVWGVLATGIAVLIGGVYALSSSPSQLNGSRPKTVSVSAEPQFRGYMVEGRSPARASNLRLEFGAQDDETEDEDSFDYDQELNPDLAPGVDIAPSTGTAGRPTVRSGAVRGFERYPSVVTKNTRASHRRPRPTASAPPFPIVGKVSMSVAPPSRRATETVRR